MKSKITQSGNQVEAQPEPTAAIAMPLGDDAKDFQMTNHFLNHVLNQNPTPR